MNKKTCNGYESAFTFMSEEDFKKHLEECEECRLEHEKMQRVSALIQEAKPYLLKESKKKKEVVITGADDAKTFLKAACAAFVVFVMGGCYSMFMMTGFYDEIVAQNTPSIEEMGLPVDEYGFLLVN